MKAVIAAPPVTDFYFTPSRASALGAAAVERFLADCGFDTVFFNFPVSVKKSRELPLPAELGHLKNHLIPGESGPLSFFSSYKRFGPEYTDCASAVLEQNPDMILISSFAWAYAEDAVRLAAAIKKVNTRIPVAVGGAGPSVNPEYFRMSGVFDFVLPGEAEVVLPEFIEETFGLTPCRLQPDPGFYLRETGKSEKKGLRYYSAVLTRGCPKNCRFCSNHLVHGRKFRKCDTGDIAGELDRIPDDYDIHLNFEDDNLLFDRDYFFEVIDIVKHKFPGAVFTAENGLDYTFLDENSVSMLTKSGFKSFNFSMASADQYLLKNERRISDTEKLGSIIRRAKQEGASSVTYFICGLEGDTESTAISSLAHLHRLPTLTGISLFYPVPGLPGYSTDRMNSFSPVLSAGSSAWPWSGSLTTTQMITAFRIARFSNLLKSIEGLVSPFRSNGAAPQWTEITERISAEKKLFTFSGGKIIEVPEQDPALLSSFLSRIL